ncbi:MAG: archaetidylserine decarboxylase [Gammaproteobacteria bacterium]
MNFNLEHITYLLPKHLISRFIGILADSKISWIKNTFIHFFIKKYHVNLNEAAITNPSDFKNFNDFFTRHLKKETRIITPGKNIIISPVDGAISQLGSIHKNKIIQAKKHDYSVGALLGSENHFFENGKFITVYLAPKDYHRIHMPFTGKLISMRYIPGSLFSVNPRAAETIPGLFAKNERVVCLFETSIGKMAVVLVGAMIVASIHTVFAGLIAPNRSKKIIDHDYSTQNILLNKGDELGHFQLGSTVIVLFENEKMHWEPSLSADSALQMGELIGEFNISDMKKAQGVWQHRNDLPDFDKMHLEFERIHDDK